MKNHLLINYLKNNSSEPLGNNNLKKTKFKKYANLIKISMTTF